MGLSPMSNHHFLLLQHQESSQEPMELELELAQLFAIHVHFCTMLDATAQQHFCTGIFWHCGRFGMGKFQHWNILTQLISAWGHFGNGIFRHCGYSCMWTFQHPTKMSLWRNVHITVHGAKMYICQKIHVPKFGTSGFVRAIYARFYQRF